MLRPLSQFDVPRAGDDSGPLSTMCSSHWFTVNGSKVVADAWYGAGVRFVDMSNPKKPRPIGVWAGDSTVAGQARFVPGRPDLVYVADYRRGFDVIKIAAGGKGAPTVTQMDEKPTRAGGARVATTRVPGVTFPVKASASPLAMTAHPEFGWACAVAAIA